MTDRAPSRPIITLTTDFGLSDHYAGAMKGVILSIAPRAEIVDISHDVGAFEIVQTVFLLGQFWTYFPKKTIHVVVVDPGVGTTRRPLLVEASGHRFLAPDNGVLTGVLRGDPKAKARALTSDRYFLKPVSRTFHWRDIFAPCAAHLARGVPPARFGRIVPDPFRLALPVPVRTGKRVWTGTVLKIDRFGNLITNFPAEEFAGMLARRFEMAIGTERVTRMAESYATAAPGELFLICGSSGYIEISLNQASAAKLLGCAAGAPAELMVW